MMLTLKLTHTDLAELVGASRQRTTEQLIEFENQQMIIRDGRRLIIVPDRLRALADPKAPTGSEQVRHRASAYQWRAVRKPT